MALTFSGITVSGGIQIDPKFVPNAPTIGTATATGATSATVTFTAPSYGGSSTITSYTATSSPGNITGTISQAGSGTITVSGLSSSTSYTFTVTATNSNGTSAASAASNSITTSSSGTPVNTVAPVVSGTTSFGSTLSCTTGTWTGNATITYTYQWKRGGDGSGYNNISGATSSTYTLVQADVNQRILCVVTGTNGLGNSSANSNITGDITALVPGAPTIGTATATGATTATVTYTAPASNGGANITQYEATSSPGGVIGQVFQAGSGTITVSGLTQNTSYTFTVTAINSAGTSNPSSASNSITTPSSGTPPVNTVAPVVSGTASFGSTLSCTTGTWTGTATITYTYQWQRNGSNISSATSSTYTLVQADVGNPIRCVVTGTNGVGNSSANSNATSNISAVVPGAPTNVAAFNNGATSINVTFDAPTSNGGATITTYTATSSPGNITGTVSQAGGGTITVSGLTTGTSYTFTVTATNSVGTGSASSASNSATPAAVSRLYSIGGYNNSYQLGDETNYARSSPVLVNGGLTNWSTGIVDTSNYGIGFGITSYGELNSWGYGKYGSSGQGLNTYSEYGFTTTNTVPEYDFYSLWSNITTGEKVTLGVTTAGRLFAWGENDYATGGALGLDNIIPGYGGISSTAQVGSLTTWSNVNTGGMVTFAVKTDGTLWAFGNNYRGQLGLNSSSGSYYGGNSSPTQVGSDTNWAKAASDGYSSFGLKTNGTLWAWGNNYNGTLGLGNTTNTSSPQQVGSDTNWADFDISNNVIVARKTNSTLWAWGRNQAGQLGQNNLTNRSSPVQIGALTSWSKATMSVTGASGGQTGVAALKTDGTVWVWGGPNFGGILGLGDTVDRSSPTQLGSGTNWTNIGKGTIIG